LPSFPAAVVTPTSRAHTLRTEAANLHKKCCAVVRSLVAPFFIPFGELFDQIDLISTKKLIELLNDRRQVSCHTANAIKRAQKCRNLGRRSSTAAETWPHWIRSVDKLIGLMRTALAFPAPESIPFQKCCLPFSDTKLRTWAHSEDEAITYPSAAAHDVIILTAEYDLIRRDSSAAIPVGCCRALDCTFLRNARRVTIVASRYAPSIVIQSNISCKLSWGNLKLA